MLARAIDKSIEISTHNIHNDCQFTQLHALSHTMCQCGYCVKQAPISVQGTICVSFKIKFEEKNTSSDVVKYLKDPLTCTLYWVKCNRQICSDNSKHFHGYKAQVNLLNIMN